jgi:predicted DNA-binding protein
MSKQAKPMQRYNLRLPADVIRKLEAIRKQTGAPVNELIRRAIEAWLKAK